MSFTAYNPAGEVFTTTDPMGIQTATTYDSAGRVSSVIQNYQNQGNITEGNVTSPTPADANLTTEYLYASGSGASSVSQLEPNTDPSADGGSDSVGGTAVTGTGAAYLMYSVNTADTPNTAGAAPSQGITSGDETGKGDVVAVRYQNGWQYCQSVAWYAALGGGSTAEVFATPTWVSFTPRPDDVLVAAIGGGSYTSLKGQSGMLDGIQYGYASGSLAISFSAPKYYIPVTPVGGNVQNQQIS